MVDELNQYFKILLLDPNTDRARAIQDITNNSPAILTKNHNKIVLRKVSMQEVDGVIMTMSYAKAHGLDGFTIDFYKPCYPMLKNEVHALVE